VQKAQKSSALFLRLLRFFAAIASAGKSPPALHSRTYLNCRVLALSDKIQKSGNQELIHGFLAFEFNRFDRIGYSTTQSRHPGGVATKTTP